MMFLLSGGWLWWRNTAWSRMASGNFSKSSLLGEFGVGPHHQKNLLEGGSVEGVILVASEGCPRSGKIIPETEFLVSF